MMVSTGREVDVPEVLVHELAQRARAILKAHDVEADGCDGLVFRRSVTQD